MVSNLIRAGIPGGHVDDRSIEDVKPEAKYDQCHFFAGIGWAYALSWQEFLEGQSGRIMSLSKDSLRPTEPLVLTQNRRVQPATIFGEQVASKDGREWLAAVRPGANGKCLRPICRLRGWRALTATSNSQSHQQREQAKNNQTLETVLGIAGCAKARNSSTSPWEFLISLAFQDNQARHDGQPWDVATTIDSTERGQLKFTRCSWGSRRVGRLRATATPSFESRPRS